MDIYLSRSCFCRHSKTYSGVQVYLQWFLANHNSNHSYATVLRPSVVCLSSVTYVLWLKGASCQKTVKKQIGSGLW